MKRTLIILTLAILLFSCNPGKKSSEIASYPPVKTEKGSTSDSVRELGDFVQKDSIVYGLMMVTKDSLSAYGTTVKAKVVKINAEGVTVKTLEVIKLKAVSSDAYNEYKRGFTWVENEKELFKTREEAIAYLKAKGLYKPNF